ncbi:MAG: hypothetical protein K6D97_07925 [Clostridia bacterium]|nr:hypothetical protein [Clostridia bacterium]
MKDKMFYSIVIVICFIGIVTTGLLVKYTVNLSKHLSITAYISNEE